jgi:hypothetical protein
MEGNSPMRNGLRMAVRVMADNPDTETILRLTKEVEFWKAKAQSAWEIVEDVACGTKLSCERCGEYMPCNCDKYELR